MSCPPWSKMEPPPKSDGPFRVCRTPKYPFTKLRFCTTSCGHCCSQQSPQVSIDRIRIFAPPLSVTLPPPSSTVRRAAPPTLAVAVITIVTGFGPQSKVMMPPAATALTTAADVPPAGCRPRSRDWGGWC